MFQNICGFSYQLVDDILVIRPLLEFNAESALCATISATTNSNEHRMWYKPVAFTMVSRSHAQTLYIGYSDSRMIISRIVTRHSYNSRNTSYASCLSTHYVRYRSIIVDLRLSGLSMLITDSRHLCRFGDLPKKYATSVTEAAILQTGSKLHALTITRFSTCE